MADWQVKTQQQLNFGVGRGYYYTTNTYDKSSGNGIYLTGPNGKDYVYIPKEYTQKGIVITEDSYPTSGIRGTIDKQYFNTAFLKPETYKNAFSFTVPDSIKNSDAFKQIGYDDFGKDGFLIPADYYETSLAKDNGSYKITEFQKPIQGMSQIAPEIFNINSNAASLKNSKQEDFVYLTDVNQSSSGNSAKATQTVIPYGQTSPQAYSLIRTVNGGGGLFGGFLGDLIGSVAGLINDLGPVGKIALMYATAGAGSALAAELGISNAAGTALLNGALTLSNGGDLGDVLENAAKGAIGSELTDLATDLTDSAVQGDIIGKTSLGLLEGNNLEDSLKTALVTSATKELTSKDFEKDINDVLDLPALPASVDTETVGPMPDAGSLGVESDLPVTVEDIFQTPIDAGSLGVASDLPPTLDDIIQTLPPVDAGSLGQESDLPEIPPSDAEMPPTQGLDTTLPPAPPTLDEVLQGVKDVAKVAALVNTADAVLNPPTQETVKKGFDIVPVPTEWKSPTYDQTFTPVDLDSIFKNLQGTQYQWKPRPDITGGAYMGSPVNISDIVNKIMSAELTPTTMPSQITNAVGGILGPTATR